MAFFKTIDFLKRNNAEVLVGIVSNKGEMTLGKKADGTKVNVNAIKLGSDISQTPLQPEEIEPLRSALVNHCETVKGSPPQLRVNDMWFPVTQFFKDPRFVPKPKDKSMPEVRDKEFQQRQEKSLVETVNQWSQPVKIENFQYKICYAKQAPDFGPHGKENLVDVVVWDEKNFSYNVSCKMSHAADLGSGGMAGMQMTVPDLVTNVYQQVQYDLYGMGFQEGWTYNITQIPTLLYCIPYTYALTMFAGSVDLGGKVDYFYIGPEKVTFDGAKLNGEFWPVEKYAKKKPFYLRLRKRNVFNKTVKINFTKLNSYGLPCIFTSGSGDFSAARFVIDDRVPPNAIVRYL